MTLINVFVQKIVNVFRRNTTLMGRGVSDAFYRI
uniref:Uncharacterized protein n=1 Tax=Anguilla anguilla TaxID=7936 RepID=A0A0E9R9T0_ANGAN